MAISPILLKYKIHHLFVWVLLLGIWYFLRYEDFSTPMLAFKISLIKVIDLAMMIYITNGLLIPRLLYKKRYGLFVLAFVVLVVSSSVLKMNLLGRIMNSPQLYSLGGNLKGRIYDNILPHFFLVIAGASVKLMRDHARLQQRMTEIAKEKAEAELNFLKLQINPHFLFNSINSVYFLIEKNNSDARTALGKFSDMLRYQLYEMNDDCIPIEKEIRYLGDYVDLQKLRKDHHYRVNCNFPEQVKGFSIEPLLLIPFVENAFKHISHYKDQVNCIQIEMDYQQDEFCFRVKNSTENTGKKTELHSGIGLNNVRKRLTLLYPGMHKLDIHQNESSFQVELKIQITRRS
jgi:sensor histidine kinase YesM